MAETFRHSDPDIAEAEARNALAAFERLGAIGESDMTAALLRELGVRAARVGPKGLPELTKREREVLRLLGEGLSNPLIAERLFVSRKTVEHHVAHILDKLGLKSRAQAAAEAVRRLGVESADK